MRTQQLRKLVKSKHYAVSHRAYMAIIWKAWEKYCHDKKINTSSD